MGGWLGGKPMDRGSSAMAWSRRGLASWMSAPSTPRPWGGSPIARRSSGVTPTVTNSMIRSPGPQDPQGPVPRLGQLHGELDDRAQHGGKRQLRREREPRLEQHVLPVPASHVVSGRRLSIAGGAGHLEDCASDTARPRARSSVCSVGRRRRMTTPSPRSIEVAPPASASATSGSPRSRYTKRELPPGRPSEQVVPAKPGIQDDRVGSVGERAPAASRADTRVVGPGRTGAEEHLVAGGLQDPARTPRVPRRPLRPAGREAGSGSGSVCGFMAIQHGGVVVDGQGRKSRSLGTHRSAETASGGPDGSTWSPCEPAGPMGRTLAAAARRMHERRVKRLRWSTRPERWSGSSALPTCRACSSVPTRSSRRRCARASSPATSRPGRSHYRDGARGCPVT